MAKRKEESEMSDGSAAMWDEEEGGSTEEVSSEEVSSEGAPVGDSSEAPGGVRVNIDTSFADMLEYDVDGKKLLFSDEPGEFVELPRKVLSELSRDNRQRYYLARGDWEEKLATREIPELSELEIEGRFETATRRLEVGGKHPGKDYRWGRASRAKEYLSKGWLVAKGDRLATADSTPSGVHKVASKGVDELVLFEQSAERASERAQVKKERSRRLVEGQDQKAESEIASVNPSATFDPKKNQQAKFSPPVDSEGRPIG